MRGQAGPKSKFSRKSRRHSSIPELAPGTKRFRTQQIARLDQVVADFRRDGHLSEISLLLSVLLMAESERRTGHLGDDCALANAMAECLGLAGFEPTK